MRTSRQAFTLIELLVVIAIIAVLSGMTMALVSTSSDKGKISRVNSDLTKLRLAIESYKSKVGVYPPDNQSASASRDLRRSPLYYELLGTTNGPGTSFTVPSSGKTVSAAVLSSQFGTGGIVNSQARPEDVQTFLVELNPKQHATIGGVELLVVPVEGPDDFVVGANNKFNTWRYNSSNPTNNPNSFDLWADIIVRRKTNTIGNWKE